MSNITSNTSNTYIVQGSSGEIKFTARELAIVLKNFSKGLESTIKGVQVYENTMITLDQGEGVDPVPTTFKDLWVSYKITGQDELSKAAKKRLDSADERLFAHMTKVRDKATKEKAFGAWASEVQGSKVEKSIQAFEQTVESVEGAWTITEKTVASFEEARTITEKIVASVEEAWPITEKRAADAEARAAAATERATAADDRANLAERAVAVLRQQLESTNEYIGELLLEKEVAKDTAAVAEVHAAAIDSGISALETALTGLNGLSIHLMQQLASTSQRATAAEKRAAHPVGRSALDTIERVGTVERNAIVARLTARAADAEQRATDAEATIASVKTSLDRADKPYLEKVFSGWTNDCGIKLSDDAGDGSAAEKFQKKFEGWFSFDPPPATEPVDTPAERVKQLARRVDAAEKRATAAEATVAHLTARADDAEQRAAVAEASAITERRATDALKRLAATKAERKLTFARAVAASLTALGMVCLATIHLGEAPGSQI